MAQKKQIALRKQALIEQLASSRNNISDKKSAIKNQLNPKTQLSRLGGLGKLSQLSQLYSSQVLKNPRNAVIGSFALALVTSILFKRKSKRKQAKHQKFHSDNKRSKRFSLVGIAFMLAKPAIKRVIIKQGKTLITKQLAARAQGLIRNARSQPSNQAAFRNVSPPSIHTQRVAIKSDNTTNVVT